MEHWCCYGRGRGGGPGVAGRACGAHGAHGKAEPGRGADRAQAEPWLGADWSGTSGAAASIGHRIHRSTRISHGKRRTTPTGVCLRKLMGYVVSGGPGVIPVT